MIIPKNTLKEISGRYPQDKEQLLDISGFGPVKVEKYGDLILDTVVNHVKDNNIEVNFREKKKLKIIIDGDSRKNEEIAIDMLRENKSLEEIASYLEISISTILGYVTDYIKAGGEIDFELELDKYYDLEVAATIIDVCEEEGIDKISIIKKKLPDYIKYESIRAVILKKYYNI
jgi:ATP-dependent DNA helicase RecQ